MCLVFAFTSWLLYELLIVSLFGWEIVNVLIIEIMNI